MFVVLLGAWLLLFHIVGNSTLGYTNTPSLFKWYWWVLTVTGRDPEGGGIWQVLSKDEAHIWFIPLVVLLLYWHRRERFLAMPKAPWWPALGLLALAILVHVVGFKIQQTRVSIAGFFLGIYAVMGLVWGPAWLKESVFPFSLFVFCMPLGPAVEFVTFPLRVLSAEASTFVGKWLLGLDVHHEGTRIVSGNGRFQYDVAPACSGIRSLVTLLALTTIFGYLTFQRTWKRLLMVFLAAPLAVTGNTIRITSAVLVGEVFGQQAGLSVEQNLGFVTFLLALGVLMLFSHWLGDEAKGNVEKGRSGAPGLAPASSTSPPTSP
jgi:exosortase